MRSIFRLSVFFLLFLTPLVLRAGTIDFEGLSDGTILTNEYAGLTFTNTIVLTAGITLNEFEFPPHSGDNVVSDNNGPILISFSTSITDFSGYFTYLTGLTLTAYDAYGTQVDQAMSLFGSNLALSGDPGSSPNDFLSLSFAGGISSISIVGDAGGSSFTLDDIAYSPTTAVPEPTFVSLLLFGGIALCFCRKQFIR